MKKTVILLCVVLVMATPALAMDTSVEAFLNGRCYNRLIEDKEFLDLETMNVASIQRYLEFRGSYLQGFSQNGKSAALIIWEAAKGISPDSQGTWNGIVIDETTGTINPIAILVTLQKEQSLVASSNPSQWALDWAMGYGVGNTNYQGFTTQVGWGAWQLRYNFERSVQDWAATYHVGQSDWLDGYYVTYTNQATASLYRYTPHVFDGNFNFWKIYHDWFYAVGEAKLKADNENVQLINKAVTFAGANFFYIEEKDRSSGLRVEKSNHGLLPGMKADIYGQILTNASGERYIAAQSVVPNGSGVIRTMMLNIRALGGGDWQFDSSSGKGQRGVTFGQGLNNIGLKVKICGRARSIDPVTRTFFVQDGSGLAKVILPPGATLPAENAFVTVTGICSLETVQGARRPALLGIDTASF